MAEEFLAEIKEVKEKSKKRKFSQSWDLIVNLKNINLKIPENKLNYDFSLPEGRGKEGKVLFIVDALYGEAKKTGSFVILKDEIEKLGKDKKKLKKYTDEYDFWFCEAPLMPLVGKSLGIVLGPRGKMPRPIPPRGNLTPFIEMSKRVIKIRTKESPVIHTVIGTEDMKEEQIMKNAIAVMNFIKEKLPKGGSNIKGAYIKLTMSKPIKLKV